MKKCLQRMASHTSAFILGGVQKGQVNEIGAGGRMEWTGNIGDIVARRVGEESEEEDGESESDSCDSPILLGPPSPPIECSNPWIRHLKAQV